MATVEDNRMTARLDYPGISLMAPVLHARLMQEDQGTLVRGEIMPTRLIGLVLWLVVAIVLVAAAARSVAAGNAWALVMVAAMISAFAAVTPGLRRAASRHQQEAVDQLEAALRARFAVDD